MANYQFCCLYPNDLFFKGETNVTTLQNKVALIQKNYKPVKNETND